VDAGSFTKDLSFVHKDLSSIIILDNSPGAYKGFPGKYLNFKIPFYQPQKRYDGLLLNTNV